MPLDVEKDPFRPPQQLGLLPAGPSHTRIVVSTLLCLAAAFAYICRNSLAPCEKIIRLDLGLTEKQMGVILGPAFFWSYALAQIPTGWLGERLGSRRCLPLYSIVWSGACAMFAVAAGYPMLLFSRVAGGLAQAGLFPCSTRTISQWHPPTERGLASGALTACMSVGGALGTIGVGILLAYMPWRWIFVIYSVPGLLWAWIFWVWFREQPADHPSVNAAERDLIETGRKQFSLESVDPPRSEGRLWLALLTSNAAWLIFTQQFFRAAGYAFFSSWFATYLQETRGISTEKSAMLTALPLIAVVLSSLFGGGLSDYIYYRTGSLGFARKGLAALTQLACAAIVYSAYFVNDASLAVLVISVGIFCSGFAGPCAYALTMDMGGKNVAPFFSTMNMMGNIGAGLLPLIVPWFKAWIESSPRLLELSNGNSWHAVLILFALMYFASAICWLLLRTHKNVYEQSFLNWSSKTSDTLKS